MLEQRKNSTMDREEYCREKLISPKAFSIIEGWNVCPYSDDIGSMFSNLKLITKQYLHKRSFLDYVTIINIVQDLRFYYHSYNNSPLSYFTDIFCDFVLIQHINLTALQIYQFEDYIDNCEGVLYLKN